MLSPLPLVGRERELDLIRTILDRCQSGVGTGLILSGEGGVGKSRLLQVASRDARARGWFCASGRGYSMDIGVPYSLFADALRPMAQSIPPDMLASLARGSERELSQLLPHLRPDDVGGSRAAEDPADLKARLLWNSWQFLARLSRRQPLLLALDDIQWADASSLDLLHFVIRQIRDHPIAVLCAYNSSLREHNPRLRTLEQSLVAGDLAQAYRVGSLTPEETEVLVRVALGSKAEAMFELAPLLHERTRGNPFFLEEILKTLARSGSTAFEGERRWPDLNAIELPSTVRDAVLFRLEDLSAAARQLADVIAVVDSGISHDLLRAVTGTREAELVAAVEELRQAGVLEENEVGEILVYSFVHPLFRETLYGELGRGRARMLHGTVAEALERHYGQLAEQHADQLAYHFVRAGSRDLAHKASRFLAVAGRAALAKHSNREAADYLHSAVEAAGPAGVPAGDLVEDLARARQRMGEFDVALELWERLLAAARIAGEPGRIAKLERRVGLVHYWSGRPREALESFSSGARSAEAAGDAALLARLRLLEGECMLELGRPAEARECVAQALSIAEALEDRRLLSRVNLAMLSLHTWIGPPSTAASHGREVLRLAPGSDERPLQFAAHWGLGLLAGLTGDPRLAEHHIGASSKLADEMNSPLHRLRVLDLTIELALNSGDWDRGIVLGERGIATARALNQRAILPRLLVTTALIHFGRADLDRGSRYVDEAWAIAGIGRPIGAAGVHTGVAVHVGRVAGALASGNFEEAVLFGEAGLAIVDGTGYTVWGIHRLLPLLAEAYLMTGNLEGAARIGARLRLDSERLGHRLGLAWAEACDAILVWLGGDIPTGGERLRQAVAHLESIPALPDATRLRRHLAARLRDQGEHAEALRELRHIHEIFNRLGAERELVKTREQIRELGARPPVRSSGMGGLAGITARELEIARLVADRKSNKAIAKLLDISVRTVSTHLANIFRKLEVVSRVELAEVIRKSSSGRSPQSA